MAMKKISGFTYVHNSIESGIPINESIWTVWPYVDEMVVVDCESTDGTRGLLEHLGVEIVSGVWDYKAGETLRNAHALNTKCNGDIIVHFEADEVFDEGLIQEIRRKIDLGFDNISVWRLQLEQNFQRCRWWPELVHRVFPKGSVTKAGHTTSESNRIQMLEIFGDGWLWDITNCFRDNWLTRVENQARLWNQEPQYKMIGIHGSMGFQNLTKDNALKMLNESHWIWPETPFDIPDILKPLVGQTKYDPYSLNKIKGK